MTTQPKMKVPTKCPFCKKLQVIEVYEEDLKKWASGVSARTSFPYLSLAECEALNTGICDDCFPCG